MIAALLCVTLTIPFSSPAYNNIVWFPNCIHSSCWIRKFSGLLEFLYSRVWYLYLNSAVLNKKLISAGLRSFQLYFWWDCTTHRCCAAEPPTWIWVKLWDCWIARWEERWAGTSSSTGTGLHSAAAGTQNWETIFGIATRGRGKQPKWFLELFSFV